MSEPIRTSPAKRKQLAAALKRNMARRKGVSRQADEFHEASLGVSNPPRVGGEASPTITKGTAS